MPTLLTIDSDETHEIKLIKLKGSTLPFKAVNPDLGTVKAQYLYLHERDNATIRDFNENPKEWKLVGTIVNPYGKTRLAIIEGKIPQQIANDIKENETLHNTVWRF